MAYFHLSLGYRQVYFRVFLAQSIFCYIHGHHKQYIQVDIIFNYMFLFGFPGTCLEKSPHTKVYFPNFSKDLFLEVPPKTCILIWGLLGYIAYGVHLCNNILIFQGQPKNGPARHPVLGTGMKLLSVLQSRRSFFLTPLALLDVFDTICY